MCAPRIPGAQVSAVDTPQGIRTSFSAPASHVEALRAALQDMVPPHAARAAGGAPQAPTLPPAKVTLEHAPGGALLSYEAQDPSDTGRLRQLVRWDVTRMQQGYCSSVALPPAQQARASGGQPLAPQAGSEINLDALLTQQCGIGEARAFFAFDSAALRSRAEPMLEALATCLTNGPLSGRKLRVTGRADPRGPEDYNAELGLARARAIATYLTEAGMAQENIQVVSVGEDEATGTEEQGWAWDRRVDISLMP
jgi:peptidoglycan-associated lipoprotein